MGNSFISLLATTSHPTVGIRFTNCGDISNEMQITLSPHVLALRGRRYVFRVLEVLLRYEYTMRLSITFKYYSH